MLASDNGSLIIITFLFFTRWQNLFFCHSKWILECTSHTHPQPNVVLLFILLLQVLQIVRFIVCVLFGNLVSCHACIVKRSQMSLLCGERSWRERKGRPPKDEGKMERQACVYNFLSQFKLSEWRFLFCDEFHERCLLSFEEFRIRQQVLLILGISESENIN